ncbi:MAG: nucleoside-diphosphate kinase [Clostridia bacterium]|nr:nucleoside-diphosphate kinase [Clostridia bacterium]
MERTLVLVKPDGVQRGLVGQVVARLEAKGLRLAGLKLVQADRALAERHYEPLRDRPFYPSLVAFITAGPVVAMAWEGPRAVRAVRQTIGATDPLNAEAGTIRGDFALDIQQNLVHGSDSPESAEREIALWFRPDELVAWRRADEEWAFGSTKE